MAAYILNNLVLTRKLARGGIFVAIVVCVSFKFSFNPPVLQMETVVDFTSRDSSYISGETIKPKHTLNNIEVDKDRKKLNSHRVSTTDVWIPDTTRSRNFLHTSEKKQTTVREIKTLDSERKYTSHLKSRIFITKFSDEKRIKVKSSNSVFISQNCNLTVTSAKQKEQKVYKKHPNERDFQVIASGKFIVEDLMKQGPFENLKNYRNPCWKYDDKNSSEPPIRCLPYFYLIGAPKSGTTDMHRRLIKHPEISKLVIKEPHWLTRKHYYDYGENGGYSNLTHYLKVFKYATKELFLRNDSGGFHNVIFGDCSASTLWDNDYWTILPEFRNLSEPLYTNADYIHHLNPNAKIIVMLRNPVERLYSDYLYFQHGRSKMFHEGVKNTLKHTYNCLRNNSLRHCLYTPPKDCTGIMVRIRIGVYHLHLKEYFRVFPREQILVIKLEDFSRNTASYMQQIFSFLEIKTLHANDLNKIANPDLHANARRKKDHKAGEMLPESRKMLDNFYRPHNDLLSNLIGEQFNYNRDYV
ncbi:carbohydrate sulfotransferase 15-like [Ruditapes philippinarum]|uniref:carbohydrate sulfotransferase 15-like n=1 Tax=Ruditapes philippinarum TaxID=129788 RepID=UPI00295B1B4B|nr:carbohydrate sulfotransferase 15-like [Ruditapes philippinarum]